MAAANVRFALPTGTYRFILEEIADLLEGQGANPFRVKAYREGATTVRSWECSVAAILQQQGPDGLQQLPGIGRSLAGSIEHLVRHGDLPMLVRLRGDHVPEQLLSSVADIGPKLAERIHHQLGIETLTELAAAERDGRLAKIPGMGEKRLRAVRESLAGRFHTSAAQPPSTAGMRCQKSPIGLVIVFTDCRKILDGWNHPGK